MALNFVEFCVSSEWRRAWILYIAARAAMHKGAKWFYEIAVIYKLVNLNQTKNGS